MRWFLWLCTKDTSKTEFKWKVFTNCGRWALNHQNRRWELQNNTAKGGWMSQMKICPSIVETQHINRERRLLSWSPGVKREFPSNLTLKSQRGFPTFTDALKSSGENLLQCRKQTGPLDLSSRHRMVSLFGAQGHPTATKRAMFWFYPKASVWCCSSSVTS